MSSVREATRRHLPLVHASFTLSFAPQDTFKQVAPGRARIACYVAQQAGEGRLLVSHGGLCFAALEPTSSSEWYVAWLSAWPHGRGRGRELLDGVCDRADAAGVDLVLHCTRDLAGWYRAVGFRPAPVTSSEKDQHSLAAGLVKLRRTRPRR